MSLVVKSFRLILRGPILLYRYMISPFLPMACRHLPTCSQYASDAIELNGAWKGGWLAFSRILRCNPWGSNGLDPAPDIRDRHYPLYAAWRYGCWSGAHITEKFAERKKGEQRDSPKCDCNH